MNYRVTKCVCAGVAFSEWLRIKRETGATMEQMAERTGCGEGCGMCRPYLEVVARTGEVSLPPLLPEDTAPNTNDDAS